MTNTITFGSDIESAPTLDAEPPHLSRLQEANLSSRGVLEPLRAGNRQNLEALLESARPKMTAVALKVVRNRDDAEDVVQEAMLKVWRYVGRFEGRAALSTWLHRIVVNTAIDHLRSRKLAPVAGRPAGDQEDGDRAVPEGHCDETPEDLLVRAQVGDVVRRGIARLSLVHRQVLALRELEGETYQSIAEIARCPVGTVMSRLHHARQKLAETLAPEGPELMRQAA